MKSLKQLAAELIRLRDESAGRLRVLEIMESKVTKLTEQNKRIWEENRVLKALICDDKAALIKREKELEAQP